MKKAIFLLIISSFAVFSYSQNYKLTWGQEIKFKKGTTDLEIVTVDNSGIYLREARMVRSPVNFGLGPSFRAAYKLFKFDKSSSELFETDYKKDLKGLSFHSMEPLQDELFMFATDYEKRDKLFKVYGAKIDKTSGDLQGDFTELGSYQLESKKDDYELAMKPIENGKAFLLISNISGSGRVSLGISILDNNLRKKQSTIINLNFKPSAFSLIDVQYTREKKIVLLTRQTDPSAEPGTDNRPFSLAVYSMNGKKERDIKLDAGDRFVTAGRLVEQPEGGLLLTGFYSNNPKKQDLSGFFINKVNAESGEISLSSYKEINQGMLGKNFINTDENGAEIKENEKEIPNDFRIRSVTINPVDNSIIITSEKYHFKSATRSRFENNRMVTTTSYTFTNQDILVIAADKDGQIKWLNAIPKSQVEAISTLSPGASYDDFAEVSLFAMGGGMPFYSSFTSLLNKDKFILLVNDHIGNTVNPGYGDKVKGLYNDFRKNSSLYAISMDMATGKMTRKMIATNNTDDILAPRHAFVLPNNEVLIPSWRQHMLAKSELKFARLVIR